MLIVAQTTSMTEMLHKIAQQKYETWCRSNYTRGRIAMQNSLAKTYTGVGANTCMADLLHKIA